VEPPNHTKKGKIRREATLCDKLVKRIEITMKT
jgi:hypothetical protein